jgi:amidophosphoribosyltransferase
MLAHNVNLTNTERLKQDMFLQDLRHVNTNSDSEVLLNVLAHELQLASTKYQLDAETVFRAVAGVHRRVRGAYAVVAMIAGYGLLAFRDPFGIRPLVVGRNETEQGPEYLVASESVALDTLGFKMLRDIEPGEAVLIDTQGHFTSRQCAEKTMHAPCMFEYVYLARPDSLMDGVSVYETRVKMGEFLADKIRHTMPHLEIHAVIPIPDSSRPAAMELARRLDLPYREGFVKNRYIGRTFIMPGQASRKKSVRQKLNAIAQEFRGKNVLLVDDSIVRGTTSREIITMAREAGATKVYFASASPPVRHANVYGIDMPSRGELIAAFRTDEEIQREIGADALIYQDIDTLKKAVHMLNPSLNIFETSCFDGFYVTGDITAEYLENVENARDNPASHSADGDDSAQLDLNLILEGQE